MNFQEIIAIKRDGGELSGDQIRTFVAGATDGSIGDEQLAAMLMAICIRGASTAETAALVESMRDSGEQWRLEDSFPGTVDKHSTGGVGDSVSLVFAPLVAACGVPVAMMAGAGLGHTQGTLDKLSAVPGFAVAGDAGEARARMEACGVCFAGQSERIAPADRTLYALRDLTGTVPSVPLIVASIMSKKLAVGAGRLVLDVKAGSGAFCKTPAQAETLARGLHAVAKAAGVRSSVLISDMSQPLASRLGCASEVRASLGVLEGRGEGRLAALSLALAQDALVLAGRTRAGAEFELAEALSSGRARAAWDRIVVAHGGDPDPTRLPEPVRCLTAVSARAGYVAAINSEVLGWLAVSVGAGRRTKSDAVDLAAGLVSHAAVGDRVEKGAPLVTFELGARPVELDGLLQRAVSAFDLADAPPPSRPLVLERLAAEG